MSTCSRPQIEEQILKVEGLSPHFQVELWREDRLDCMTVHVEAVSHAADGEGRSASAVALRERIKEVIGVSVVRQNVTEPRGRGRGSQGKAQRIVDNRPKG